MTDLVVISLERWDEVWRRNQYLVDGLLRADPSLRVLFVEPATDPLHDLASRRRPRLGAGTRVVDGFDGRLVLAQSTKALPRAAGRAADALLWRSTRRAMRRAGWTDPVVWVNDPLWAGFAAALGGPTVYDMTDDWVQASREGRVNRRLHAADDALMRSADEVVVCSTGLAASRGRVREVTLIPNAVDVARYRIPRSRPDDLPPGRVALYVGTLHDDRLDVDASASLASTLRDRGDALVLVGPDALSPADGARLRAAGAFVLGARPHEEIPAYLQHADVLVVPHRITAFTESLDPLKLYEYQAAGRPIVATPVAGFRELDGHPGVSIAESAHLGAAVVGVLDAPPGPLRWTAIPDWSERVAAFAEVLARVREKR